MKKNKHIIIAVVCWLLLFASLIPLMSYAKYTNPSADDYTYSRESRYAYEDTSSFMKAVKAGIDSTLKAYESWQGTYSGTFMMAISPNVFSLALYKAAPVILMFLFMISTLFFAFCVVKILLDSRIVYAFIIAPVIVFLSLQFIPSLVEGIYWYNGAWYYTFSFCLSLILFSLIIILIKRKTSLKTGVLTGLTSILAFLLGGVNFTTSFMNLVILLLITAYLFYIKHKSKYYLLVITSLNAAGVLISYIAPGNNVRSDVINSEMSVFDAVFYSFKGTFSLNFAWITHTLLLFFIFLMIPLFKKMIKDSNHEFKNPLIFTAALICVFSVQFTPPLYAMSSFGPYRLINIVYYSSIWFIMALFIYAYGYFIKRKKESKSVILNRKKDSKFKMNWLLCIISLIVYLVSADFNTMSFMIASENIKNGSAESYDDQFNERLMMLENPEVQNIEFHEFTVKPYGLYFDDVEEDPKNWKNNAMSEFYHKNSIVLKKQAEQ